MIFTIMAKINKVNVDGISLDMDLTPYNIRSGVIEVTWITDFGFETITTLPTRIQITDVSAYQKIVDDHAALVAKMSDDEKKAATNLVGIQMLQSQYNDLKTWFDNPEYKEMLDVPTK
jgi:hypothetical protein